MKELSLHILDLAQNSVSAGASLIEIGVADDHDANALTISISDNGRGMSAEFLKQVTDPFTTSRTTRKVGLGIPLMKMACEQCGGNFAIESEPGKGTELRAVFSLDHIDRAPMGSVDGTIAALIQGSPGIEWIYRRESKSGGKPAGYVLSTLELREVLGPDVPLDSPDVIAWITEYIEENEGPLPPL